MPHQCLGCGHAFEEGSAAILQGCPQCKGTRFFYSAVAVDDAERERIAAKAQKDLRQVVTDMLTEADPEVGKSMGDGWTQLKPKDLRRLVKKVQDSKKQESFEYDDAVPAPRPGAVTDAEARLAAQADEAKPDTVTVGDGEYEIDVKGLLEKNPIVVQKDGAYLIHLPSLFEGKK